MLPLDHVEAPLILEAINELTENDLILVIGAYKGATCHFVKYYNKDVKVVAFEPQDWAYKVLYALAREHYFVPYNVALGIEDNDKVPLYEYGTDAASFLNIPGSRALGSARCVDAAKFLRDHDLTGVAFCIINIEGYEYALIPYLLAQPDIALVKILVQCHHKEMYRTAYGKMHESLNSHGYTMLDVGAGWELWSRAD